MQRNRTNVPCDIPQEHYKRAIAIPLLDSLQGRMKDRFSEDQCHAHGLLHLVPSVITRSMSVTESAVDQGVFDESLLHWESDLPFPVTGK